MENNSFVSTGNPMRIRSWRLNTPNGGTSTENLVINSFTELFSILNFFMTAFPYLKIKRMVLLNSENSMHKKLTPKSTSAIIKYVGILIKGTRYEFGNRAEFWKTQSSIGEPTRLK